MAREGGRGEGGEGLIFSYDRFGRPDGLLEAIGGFGRGESGWEGEGEGEKRLGEVGTLEREREKEREIERERERAQDQDQDQIIPTTPTSKSQPNHLPPSAIPSPPPSPPSSATPATTTATPPPLLRCSIIPSRSTNALPPFPATAVEGVLTSSSQGAISPLPLPPPDSSLGKGDGKGDERSIIVERGLVKIVGEGTEHQPRAIHQEQEQGMELESEREKKRKRERGKKTNVGKVELDSAEEGGGGRCCSCIIT